MDTYMQAYTHTERDILYPYSTDTLSVCLFKITIVILKVI